MIISIDADLKAAAAGIFTDEELADMLRDGVPAPRPEPIVADTRRFAERLQADREAEDHARLHARRAVQVESRAPDPALMAALNAIGTDDEARLCDPLVFRKFTFERELADSLNAYAPRTRNQDRRVWDLLPPGTSPIAGDEIEDEGVWRPRRVIADCKTRYDRTLFLRCEAQRQYEADPSEEAQKHLDAAQRRQSEALRASDEETVQQRDRIEKWRAGEGCEVYNASRRTVRATPNADLSSMTDEEMATHKREQARLRKQRSRGCSGL